ncbi:hypothetical protein OQA88_11085 [Cercophora sp. LCS_1]
MAQAKPPITMVVKGISLTKCETEVQSLAVPASCIAPYSHMISQDVNLLDVATGKISRLPKLISDESISVVQFHPKFSDLVGPQAAFSLLLSTQETTKNPMFNHICAYFPAREELNLTSNLLPMSDRARYPSILISRVVFKRDEHDEVVEVEWSKFRPPPTIPMPAAGTLYREGAIYCSQGNLSSKTGGLYYMAPGHPPEAIVTNYFGTDFNSPRSVAIARDGSIWFMDTRYGLEQEFRPEPQLPSQLYRYDPKDGDLRAMANDFVMPLSIALGSHNTTVYVADGEEGK